MQLHGHRTYLNRSQYNNLFENSSKNRKKRQKHDFKLKMLYYVAFIVLKILPAIKSSPWEIENLFQNQTLHFITTGKWNAEEENKYFNYIINHNPYTPRVLDDIPNWNFSRSRYNSRILSDNAIPLKLNALAMATSKQCATRKK